ncbi:invasion associated locus B family protein [Jannaschia ovalis]|uniref:Invasion associated locus B family protein n=1 Tax=Jannaschia ovalis TaxID=3038773 RepID=A0ABY8LDN7_9RHOB|nr:invasion associated locus B family protein [Jannaschia sp. GRR-S6-38]WGH78498.1 invasion associated locus B family protein [Jannaschia sp. GRR-S6-38]
MMALQPNATRFATIFALTAALAMPALAQDEGAPAEAPAAEQPAPTPAPAAPGGGLATGEAVGAAGGTGPEIYVREEHGAWEVRCLRAPEGQTDPCQLFQRLEDQNGNPTADINFFDLPDGNELVAGATVLTPLQTLLTAQVQLSVDGGQPRRYPFSFCDAQGCYSRMGFNAADIEAFKRGASATLVVVPALAPDQPAQLTMSLSGFTAGYAAIEVANPE